MLDLGLGYKKLFLKLDSQLVTVKMINCLILETFVIMVTKKTCSLEQSRSWQIKVWKKKTVYSIFP